jgi:putative membrane protein
MEAAIAYLHFVSILALTGFLATEFYLCTGDLQPPNVKTLARVDLLYMIAAIVVLITGLLRVFAVGKGAAFYLQNPVFYIKLALFVAVGLISILPTLQFFRWNRALKAGEERILRDRDIATARRYIALELALLTLIPLMAVLMARGIGVQAS